MIADAERIARRMVFYGEPRATRTLCLADYDDALARADSPAERRAVALCTIRLYVHQQARKDFQHAERRLSP